MLTQTTITAIRTLVHIGLAGSHEPLSVRTIAERLGESPTYMAKVTRLLAKAGILRAHRGVLGGVELNRVPGEITFLAIVEACQGTILPDFCAETRTVTGTCAFHVATAELHQAVVGVLARWTLEHFVKQPVPTGGAHQHAPCILKPCLAQLLATAAVSPRRTGMAEAPARTTTARKRPRASETARRLQQRRT